MKYMKAIENGKAVYRYPGFRGTPGREITVCEWELDALLNYCLFPLKDFIWIMTQADEDHAAILERLYSSAFKKLMEMSDAIHKYAGEIAIIMENERETKNFLEQDILDVHFEMLPEGRPAQ